MKLTISLGQMDIELGNQQENLRRVSAMAGRAAAAGADLLVLPELWSTGYDLENGAQHASPTDQGVFAAAAAIARRERIALLGSCLSVMPQGGYGNTAVWFDAAGQNQGEYSKLHLFRLMDEDQYLTAGDAPTLVETKWGLIGLTICYDLRFPELFRHYALQGANVIFVPAEWPHPRLAHWRTLLRARAIENQLFIVACNRVGQAKGSDFCGHSCVIDPWGEVLVEMDETAGLATVSIDTALVDEVRQRIPVFADRRPQLYRL